MRCLILIFFIVVLNVNAQVGINTTTPDPSSMLDITATDKGMLIPRMTKAQRTAITAPATGLLVYQTDNTDGFWYFNGVSWLSLSGGADNDWNIVGSDLEAAVTGSVTASEMQIGNTGRGIGFGGIYNKDITSQTTDYALLQNDNGTTYLNSGGGNALHFRADNTEYMTLLNNGNVGIGTSSPDVELHVDGQFKLVDGTQGAGKVLTSSGTGVATWQTPASGGEFQSIGGVVQNTTDIVNDDFVFGSTALGNIVGPVDDDRMFFDKSKGAFRAGRASGTQWDPTNVGSWSNAIGLNPIASGAYSTAIGALTNASGSYSIAMGSQTNASATVSTAMGSQTTASGNYSTAMGFHTTASGSFSTAMGNNTTALGITSTAMGGNTTASGSYSTSMGRYTAAPSYAETTIGIFSETYTPNSTTGYDASDRLFVVGNGTDTYDRGNALTILKNGHTGIGTSTPIKKLDVLTGTSGEGIVIRSSTTASNVAGHFFPGTNGFVIDSRLGDLTGAKNFHIRTGGTDRIFVSGGTGNVGIGTANPTQAKLVVSGSETTALTGAFLNSAGAIGSTGGSVTLSGYFSNSVAAETFRAFSDARIKNIQGISNSEKDLETLAKIEITDYQLKDTIAKENKAFKKVIAQQVKEVYPQAVTDDLTDVIPNIYQLSEIKDGVIVLSTDLIVGDKVKLIFSEGEELVDVTEVTENSFKVATKKQGKVFVYGKQVDDFHTVDYEAISMLNVSATQELLKRIKQLENQNKELIKDNNELSSSILNLENRFSRLESFLLKESTKVINAEN